MITSTLVSNIDFNYFFYLPQVIEAKKKVDELSNGSIYFTINLTSTIKQALLNALDLDLSNIDNIPMRWIKGDTLPHIDRGIQSFNDTYLLYLTDSEGSLIIDNESYPILKGNAYKFNEGLEHKTIGTGNVPRLLLGPMSETGISVGGASITADGATDTVYIQYNSSLTINEYRINDGIWNTLSLPVAISNSNADRSNNILKIIFTTNITLNSSADYFLCSSDGIQFGSRTLNSNGTRPIITIDTTTDYNGLINNNFNAGSGYNNIYVFNLEIRTINGAALDTDGGWIGQPYFGKGASNNFIVNCSSTGPIIDGGGGIIGAYSGSGPGASLYIIGCSSSGDLGTYSGGIIGFYAGQSGGQVICESCWSTGTINGPYAGGIFGYYAGNDTGVVKAIKCYSTGAIVGQYAGGIYGQYAGSNSTAEATDCYSQGNITADAGGIFGGNAGENGGLTPATNCYSSGNYTTSGTGIYGSNVVDDNPIRCYTANGSWSDIDANNFLNGTPNPVVGTTWVASGGDNYPYELNNMGYTPYSLTIIDSTTNNLIQNYNQTISPGQASSPAIRSGYSYDKLKISGGSTSSYETITVNVSTGIISTTSSTEPGIYIITIRNTGSYNLTTVTLTIGSGTPNQLVLYPYLRDFGFPSQEAFQTQGNKKMSGQVQRVKGGSNQVNIPLRGWIQKSRMVNSCQQRWGPKYAPTNCPK